MAMARAGSQNKGGKAGGLTVGRGGLAARSGGSAAMTVPGDPATAGLILGGAGPEQARAPQVCRDQ